MVEPRPAGGLRPVLMDFGLARDSSATEHLTETGMVMGTPAYMAPEQAQGDHSHTDVRSDVYGLGAMLYELMCGQPPFDGQSTVQVLITVMNDEPVPLRRRNPAVPIDIETIAMKCLSKEPQRRYQTALALAQDLGCFLTGEPIAARQTTWSYRVIKKARKHRALFALSGLLFVSLLALLAVGGRARLQAAEQKRRADEQELLAQRLGQVVKEMELFMRAAYALPLHDIGRERQVVRKRMAEIQQLMDSLEPAKRGPAHYALGRGHMVLHEPEQARPQLTQALQTGYDKPQVHAALGSTLAALYGAAVAQASRSGDFSALERRKRQLQEELLQPALHHLSLSTGAESESPALQRAIISSLQRDPEGMLAAARQAELEAPWNPEPLQLQAAAERLLRGRATGKLARDEAGRARIARLYARLTDMARSDPQVYLEESIFWGRQMFEELVGSRDVRPTFASLKAACEHALQADPLLPQARGQLALGYSYVARWEQASGQDPQASAQLGTRLVAEELRLHPEDELLHIIASNLHMVSAMFRIEHGLDPQEALTQSIASVKSCARLNPNLWVCRNDLVAGYLVLADYLAGHAGDPDPILEATQQELKILSQFTAERAPIAVQWGSYYATAAEAARLRGLDPRPLLAQGLATLRAQVQVQPHDGEVLEQLSALLLAQIPWTLAMGGDVAALLDEAALLIERHGQDFPHSPEGSLARTALAALRADILLRAGRSPAESLARGFAELTAAQKLQPPRARLQLLEAELLLLKAQWEQAQGHPSRELLRRAASAAGGSLRSDSGELWLAQARALRRQAMLAEVRPGERAELTAQAQQAVARARSLIPRFPAVDAEEAALRLLVAERAAPPAQRAGAGQALSLLTAALQRAPTLRDQYEPLRARAQSLSTQTL